MPSLFIEVLKLCREAGLLHVGRVALDGTTNKANAAAAQTNRRITFEPHLPPDSDG